MDDTDWRLLFLLQQDGRSSVAALAREVSMSPSAVTERLRRLEASGTILGYTARVNVSHLGASIEAFTRLRYLSSNHRPVHDLIAQTPEIVEAHHVTGEDCFILRVVAASMAGLEVTVAKVARLGLTTANVVYSSPLAHRPISAATVPALASNSARPTRAR